MRIACIAATALAALAFAGCGGDDDTSSDSGDGDNQALSYSGFGAALNEICKSVEADVNEISDGLTGDPSADADVFDDLIPALEKGTNDVEDLVPPDELKADFDKFNELTEAQLDNAKKAQTAAKAGDKDAYIAALQEVGKNSQESDIYASKLGGSDCLGS